MPQYRVKQGEKGFFNGRLYDSNGKRPVLTTDEPLDPIPSWVEPIKFASDQDAEDAIAMTKAAEEREAEEAAAAQDAQDKEIKSVTFTEAPNPTAPGKAPAVETL